MARPSGWLLTTLLLVVQAITGSSGAVHLRAGPLADVADPRESRWADARGPGRPLKEAV